PSAGMFRSDIGDLMAQIVQYLHFHKAPFTDNIYPFLSFYASDDFPVYYALFDGFNTRTIDNVISYSNVFDANFDTLVSALTIVNVGDLPIFVGEGPIKEPRRPRFIEVYLFGLVDEDAKSIAPGDFELHWGLFSYDGQQKDQ
ncbi:hypothetical protein MKW94_026345, partial [Papaver nudicaule]|nr:hypothetical protein [Papaver nudicaule]